MAHLDQSLDPGLAGRALRHDENPDGLDGAVSGLGLAARPTTEGGPRCFDGIERVGLAAAATLLAIRSVDLYDVYAHPLEVTGQARSIGAGSFDADLGDAAEVLEPRHQGLVAGGIGGETLGAEQPTKRVQCGCDVDVAVRIDTTGNSTRSFYDGHGHPFLSKLEGWHGRPGSERRAVWVVLATRTNHPNSETGRAVFNVRLEGLGRRRFATSRDSKSDRTCQHSRSYSGPAIKRWTLREVSMYGGRPGVSLRVGRLPFDANAQRCLSESAVAELE